MYRPILAQSLGLIPPAAESHQLISPSQALLSIQQDQAFGQQCQGQVIPMLEYCGHGKQCPATPLGRQPLSVTRCLEHTG